MHTREGFGSIGLTVVVALLIIIGGGALYVRQLSEENRQEEFYGEELKRMEAQGEERLEHPGQLKESGGGATSSASITGNTFVWRTYRNENYGFEVKYPKEWDVVREHEPLCDFGPAGDDHVVCIEQAVKLSSVSPNAWFTVEKMNCEDNKIKLNEWMVTPGSDGSGKDGSVGKYICMKGLLIELSLFNDNPQKEFYKKILDDMFSTFTFIH